MREDRLSDGKEFEKFVYQKGFDAYPKEKKKVIYKKRIE